MPNTCTICKHPDREKIENALARGQSLRDIAGQFEVSKSSVFRHHTCIAAQLQAFKAARSTQLNETLLQRLERYRGVAERFLKDDEKALAALDRCYKQVDIEAKLTGEYQKKQENQADPQRQREIAVEAYLKVFEMQTEDEALAAIREVYRAKALQDAGAMWEAVRAALEADAAEEEEFWHIAEEIVSKRIM
jgi:hypothetical protein